MTVDIRASALESAREMVADGIKAGRWTLADVAACEKHSIACWHEAGHAIAMLAIGGVVDRVEVHAGKHGKSQGGWTFNDEAWSAAMDACSQSEIAITDAINVIAGLVGEQLAGVLPSSRLSSLDEQIALVHHAALAAQRDAVSATAWAAGVIVQTTLLIDANRAQHRSLATRLLRESRVRRPQFAGLAVTPLESCIASVLTYRGPLPDLLHPEVVEVLQAIEARSGA